MHRASPRHRFQAVSTAAIARTPPVEPWELGLYNAMLGAPSDPVVSYAYDLYLDTHHRGVLDAFLIADTPKHLINKTLGIPENVLECYEHLFFDVAAFRNRLERVSFASDYEGDSFAAELLKTGVMVGSDYLLWTYGGVESVDTRRIVRHTMVDSFYRGMAHKGNSVTSTVAKEAQKWWATAVKNAELLEKLDPQSAKQAYEELKIALEGKDETLSTETSPVPVSEILQ